MKRFITIMVVLAACLLLPAKLQASVTVVIEQSGFSPSEVDFEENTTNYLNACLIYDQTGEEIPVDQCTFSWFVDSVYLNGELVYEGYDAGFADGDQPNCSLTASVWQAGYWYFIVGVTVTYPDGYARVIDIPIKHKIGEVYWAGSDECGTLRGRRCGECEVLV